MEENQQENYESVFIISENLFLEIWIPFFIIMCIKRENYSRVHILSWYKSMYYSSMGKVSSFSFLDSWIFDF